MNFKSVDPEVAQLFGQGRLGRPVLRLVPQNVCRELQPRPLQFIPRTGRRSSQSVVRDIKGLIPDTRSDRAESIFLAAIMGISTAAVAIAAIETAGFAASWSHLRLLVSSLIG